MPVFLKRAAAVPSAFMLFAGTVAVAPAVSSAAECGPGTVYDAPSDTCVVAPAPANWNAPPPPPPAPALPPISICPPIPFVAVCFPVS